MAQALHSQFTEEQDLLKRVWIHCKRLYDNLCSRLESKYNKLIDAKELGKEGYGDYQILSRQISDAVQEKGALSKALDQPYFGKIEYVEDGRKNTVYISRTSYTCPDADIASWEAPIANLFYSRTGTYSVLNKICRVDLQLVQRLDVKRDVLNNIYDIFIDQKYLKSDPFLIEQLGRSGKERLKDIVLTIQEEQNRIIRAPIDKHLVVQGSAGTGKTIVLVYRVAYLFHHAHNWKKSDVLLISPSKVFLGYIHSILPDADLANISTLTIEDLIPQLGKSIFNSISEFPEIMEITKTKRMTAADAAGFKGTIAFKRILDSKIEEATRKFAATIKNFNFKSFEKQESVPGSVIRKWFIEELASYPLENRVKIVRQRIKDRLDNILVDSLSVSRRAVPMYTHQETESMLAAYFREWPDFKKVFQSDLIPWYFNLLIGYGEVAAALENAQTQISESVSSWGQYFASLSQNDWAAIFYMYQRVADQKESSYKLIVIDEAQMLSPLWLAGLSYMLADDGTFLLAGDINQKPAVIDLPDWYAYEEIVGRIEVMELSKCYRLTDEIAKIALDVLMKHPSLYQFETVGRIGDEVLEISGTASQRLNRIAKEISTMLDRYQTIAIVGKSTADCEKLYQHFSNLISDIVLINDDTDFEGRVVVIPIHLVGGLEYDAVVIMDHVQYDVEDIFEAQQFYLGITRAVHKLILA